ncbi:MAG TPA: TraR/DksA C4-type zinc finger protein [Mycobacteriales bacterium]|nr:TraR/DksA C4-type zinc finger protein [Mycobacteriales bacterium]
MTERSIMMRRTADDFSHIRQSLQRRLAELRDEHQTAMAELLTLQRDRQSDTAGDDQADTGTKTFEREQELTLAHGILERIEQVERAIARIDEGNYGQCERCGNQIPIARLEAFPSATLCVECKQRQERR